ncbi:alpha/beta fold hydrolase [Acidisoma cellulosilytica]|uniref:Alpha/beta fold hydrolase n=1 Tax=Acidisoma cellulosilyticum TaxID=2802395 RepID=A0A963Z5U8_9PROT|nr:alpha/beta fold hydrolase [Acidisoma cellulosilyticum]MCB8883076.1 alpha/beta fold hydrolase [Acidisoma cellulosilyticum]
MDSVCAAEVIAFTAGDGFPLNLHHFPPSAPGPSDPVLVLHGAGVRANIFTPPVAQTFVDALREAGFDVWLLNWRASIDLPPNEWTLEDAAVFDHPAAVRTVLERTGKTSLKAVIHCQGSTSFMMAAVAGLLPAVSLIISNAVSLHPVVPALAYLKSRYMTNSVGRFMTYLNPQWGLSAPLGWPSVIDFYVRALHHECNNPVCKQSSFTFGAGFPTLWRHENLDADTHEWIKGEFAHVPMTFFREMNRCILAGVLVSSGKHPELPRVFDAQAPKTDARFVFLAGQNNQCFKPESQQRSFDYCDRHAPGRHALYELSGYGHLDVFIGKAAAQDNFPLIIDELRRA